MVDAITCCLVPGDAGTAIMKPVSDEHPLHMCSHWLTGVHIPREVGGDDSICSFHGRCGVAVLGTVMDGNCAFDAISQMLATLSVQTPQSRQSLRCDLSKYFIDRAKAPWMHDLLVSCQEIEEMHLESYRLSLSSGPSDAPPPAAPAPDRSDAAVAACATAAAVVAVDTDAAVAAVDPELAGKALAWATHSNDEGVLLNLQSNLPAAVLEEQIRNYLRASSAATTAVAVPVASPTRVAVHSLLLKSRMQVAALYDAYLDDLGCGSFKRAPYGAIGNFVNTRLLWPQLPLMRKYHRERALHTWHRTWKKNSTLQHAVVKKQSRKRGAPNPKGFTPWSRRQRQQGLQGRPHACAVVRELLY